jgi:hypothetical protein
MNKYVTLNEFYYISSYTNEKVDEDENQIEIYIPEEYQDIFDRKFMFFKIIDNNLIYDDASYLNNLAKKTKYQQLLYLKNLLKETDYKVIKCYEAQLGNEEMPYDLQELLAQRKAWRDEINALEFEMSMLG